MDTVVEYPTFYPKLLSGIGNGNLSDTIKDRSIEVRMRRLLPSESVAEIDEESLELEAIPLKAQILDWVAAKHRKHSSKNPSASMESRTHESGMLAFHCFPSLTLLAVTTRNGCAIPS